MELYKRIVLLTLLLIPLAAHAQWRPLDPDDIIEVEPNQVPGIALKTSVLAPFQPRSYAMLLLEAPLNQYNSVQLGLGYIYSYAQSNYRIEAGKANLVLDASYRHYFPVVPLYGFYWGPGLAYHRMNYMQGRRFCTLQPDGTEQCGVNFNDPHRFRDDEFILSWRVGLQPKLSDRILLDIWGGLAGHYLRTVNTYLSVSQGGAPGEHEPTQTDLSITGLIGFNLGYVF